MSIAKIIFQYFAVFLLTIIANSLFQTVCQNFWSAQDNGDKVCSLTKNLPSHIYLVILLIISTIIFTLLQKKLTKKEQQITK